MLPSLTWLAVALLPAVFPNSDERSRVLGGEVLVAVEPQEKDTVGPPAVRAAIRIAAPPGRVFAIMTSCAEALRFVPRLESCRVVESAADGRHEVIEQVVNLRWFLPRIRFLFRADYRPPLEVRISNVSGGLRVHEGRWTLEPLEGGTATLVVYRVRVEPRYPVPQWLVLATLRSDLPATLRALAARCAGPA
jgi:hypothetical protein